MVIKHFPPLESAGPEGLLAIGGDLEIDSLQLAYSKGIFPWPTEDFPLLWFSPPNRAILEFKDLNIPRRHQRARKNLNFTFKVDQDFTRVIQACAEGLTRSAVGTWVTPEMIKAYIAFHRAGYAHSFEAYNDQGKLVGGLYGVSLGGMFAGESMFFWETGASKETLLYCIDYLKSRGLRWMDVQMISPLLKSFGAKEINRELFIQKLQIALNAPPLF